MIAYLLIEDLNPIPWQSPELGIGRAKGGKPFPTATSPANMKNYQAGIRECCAQAYPEIGKDTPLFLKRTTLYVWFFFWRELDQFHAASGRRQTAQRADVSNLTKSTEDALQGFLYHNDTDNRQVLGHMFEQGPDVDRPRLLVVAADSNHKHVMNLFLDDGFVQSYVTNISDNVPTPTPPGNVRLRVVR